MDKKEKLDKVTEIKEFIDQINSESTEESLILVEGKKDIEALSYLGICGNIRTYHNFKNTTELVDHFRRNHKKLILLLDSDRSGEIMKRKICNQLNEKYVDHKYKKKLVNITQGRLKKIEELKRFYNSISGN